MNRWDAATEEYLAAMRDIDALARQRAASAELDAQKRLFIEVGDIAQTMPPDQAKRLKDAVAHYFMEVRQ